VNWITLFNIENAPRVEKAFRLVFMVSNGKRTTVRELATTPIKTGATEGEKTNNDGMQTMKRIVRFSCQVRQWGGIKLSPALAKIVTFSFDLSLTFPLSLLNNCAINLVTEINT
jgi:hypothetical protein